MIRVWHSFLGFLCVSLGGTHIILTSRFDTQTLRLRTWARRLLNWGGIHWDIEGIEHLENSPPAILVSNHASSLDIPLLLAAVPRTFRMVAKKELLSVPFIGWVIRRAGFIPIQRYSREEALEALKEIRGYIESGVDFYLAAEGTRTRTGDLLPFKKGPFVLAIELGIPVIPITLHGTFHALPKGTFLPRSDRTLLVRIHAPLSTEGMTYDDRDRLRDQAREVILKDYQDESRAS
ncbi:MAG TPA: lysophospholipid acyltransferase family protein [Thermoanaerobaculia bacterium]|nr:lysophospholipid acyltransferase family protein [Thermoanaerobaculia bacterium]HUM31022.1 lysophospholipid acyltransferase family protein [Thermoanaerobaculia bacterium]HXK69320.1 lysophospholipid acyltransferase family protein [Thermoanaerobaculia bacterium]